MPRCTTRVTVARRSADMPTAAGAPSGMPPEAVASVPASRAATAPARSTAACTDAVSPSVRAPRAALAEKPNAEDAPSTAATAASWTLDTRPLLRRRTSYCSSVRDGGTTVGVTDRGGDDLGETCVAWARPCRTDLHARVAGGRYMEMVAPPVKTRERATCHAFVCDRGHVRKLY